MLFSPGSGMGHYTNLKPFLETPTFVQTIHVHGSLVSSIPCSSGRWRQQIPVTRRTPASVRHCNSSKGTSNVQPKSGERSEWVIKEGHSPLTVVTLNSLSMSTGENPDEMGFKFQNVWNIWGRGWCISMVEDGWLTLIWTLVPEYLIYYYSSLITLNC